MRLCVGIVGDLVKHLLRMRRWERMQTRPAQRRVCGLAGILGGPLQALSSSTSESSAYKGGIMRNSGDDTVRTN